MAGTCTFLGIYPDNIEDGGDSAEAVLDNYGIDIDDFWSRVNAVFSERYGKNFGNTVNYIIFCELESMLRDSGKLTDNDDVDFEINGSCLDFIVNGESAL